MKKYLLGLLVVAGLLVSFTGVHAQTTLSEQKVNAIVQILRAFEVDETKIDSIVNILRGPTGCENGNKFNPNTGKPCHKEIIKEKVEPIINKCFMCA